MNGWAGTRAEREWLATLRRIADSLALIGRELRRLNVREDREGDSEEDPR